jgi:WD40 repeat protein
LNRASDKEEERVHCAAFCGRGLKILEISADQDVRSELRCSLCFASPQPYSNFSLHTRQGPPTTEIDIRFIMSSAYVSVMPDWELVVSGKYPDRKKFWVSSYRGEEVDVHCDCGVTGTLPEALEVASDNKAIDVAYSSSDCSLRVVCGETGAQSTVRGPLRTLSELHQKYPTAEEAAAVGFVPHKEVFDFDVSASAQRGVSASEQGDLKVWDLNAAPEQRNMVRLKGHVGDVNLCRFFPDPQLVLSAADDKSIKVWACENGQCALTLNTLAAEGDVKREDIASARHSRRATMLEIVAQGEQVVSAAADGQVLCWDIARAVPVSGARDCGVPVVSGCAIGGGAAYATGCEDGRVRLYDFRALTTSSSSYSSSSSSAALASSPSSVIKLGQPVSVTACHAHPSSDRALVLGTQEGQILLIDLRKTDSAIYDPCSKGSGAIRTLGVAADGKVWSGHAEGDVSLWDLSTQAIECELTGADCIPINKLQVTGDSEVYAASTELRHYKW